MSNFSRCREKVHLAGQMCASSENDAVSQGARVEDRKAISTKMTHFRISSGCMINMAEGWCHLCGCTASKSTQGTGDHNRRHVYNGEKRSPSLDWVMSAYMEGQGLAEELASREEKCWV